ncbi:hypothetical protein XENOCAPTIV_000353, partial [Xenoophorus captivus]
VLYKILKSEKVSERNKQRIKLKDFGYLGLICFLEDMPVTMTTVRCLYEQVLATGNTKMPVLTSETSWLWSVCPIELSSPSGWTSVARSVLSHLILNVAFWKQVCCQQIQYNFLFLFNFLQLFHLIYSNEDYVKQLAKQPSWQDVLTKLFVKESLEAHDVSITDSGNHGSFAPSYRPPLRRDPSVVVEESRTDIYLNYRNSQDDEEEDDNCGHRDISEGFSDLSQSPSSGGGGQLKNYSSSLHFKSFDSVDQGSHSSSTSNPVDIASPRPDDEGRDYQPLSPFGISPFDLELGGMGDTSTHTPAGSLTNTPSPLEHSKPFSPLRPRKSSSLSNVLDDTSYGTDPPTGDTISNTSNPQVYLLHLLKV